MTQVISIRLEVPDGVEVRVSRSDDPGDEPLPPPEWGPPEEQWPVVQMTGNSRNGNTAGVCPVHRIPWRVVPAGVSKKTGRPYAAFTTCPEMGCGERPR